MRREIIITIISWLILLIAPKSHSQAMPDSWKKSIYRTETKIGVGTSICIKDSVMGIFFLTCKHLIMIDSSLAVDTIKFYRNEFFPNGTIYSGNKYFSVALENTSSSNYIDFPGDIDIAIIMPSTKYTISNPANLNFQFLPSDSILGSNTLQEMVKPGSAVEVIGFEFQQLGDKQYYFSRFGHVSLYPPIDLSLLIDGKLVLANFILLDISSRPGDSGAPVFLFNNSGVHLIGIHAATSFENEYGIVYPISYAKKMLDIGRAMIQLRK